MIRAQLLQHFDTLAETPEAVEKFRKLVLDFAIRGRLVPQNPKDEPAIQLVERAKAGLTKKREKSTDQQNGEHEVMPFSLPKNWCWTCLEELGETSPRNELDDKTEVGFSPMRLVNAKFGVPILFERKIWSEVRKGFTHFAEGDVVVAKITPCFENGKSGVIRGAPNGFGAGTTEFHVLRPVANCVLPEYVLAFLKSPHFLINGEKHMTGSAGQKRVPSNYFAKTPFPLPPLSEQRRIVAKVEELLALCDELEARQTAAREHRARLVRSALDHLTTAQDESDFKKHSAFCLQHSELLFDSLPALRQAIIQLAVLGRLSEPVISERVDSTAEENVTAASLAEEATNGQTLPSNWLWLRFRDVLSLRHGHQFREYDFVPSGIPVIKIGQCKRDGTLDLLGCDYIAANRLDEFKDFRIEKDDILMALTGGTLGKVTVVNRDYGPAVQNYRVGKFLPKESLYTKGFTQVVLLSGFFQTLVFEAVNQNAQPNIGKEKMEELVVPVPPLAEQQRIVAKVDELLRWCDALEARLTAAQTTATHLLDATLHQILTA